MISLHTEVILFIDNSDPKVNPDQQCAASNILLFLISIHLNCGIRLVLTQAVLFMDLAFFEAANGWYSFKDYNPFQLRSSVGVGMRFFLPMFGLLDSIMALG